MEPSFISWEDARRKVHEESYALHLEHEWRRGTLEEGILCLTCNEWVMKPIFNVKVKKDIL